MAEKHSKKAGGRRTTKRTTQAHRSRLRDFVIGVGVFMALMAAWPAFSAVWVEILRGIAVSLSESGSAFGPATAPSLLPAALGVIATIPGTVQTRAKRIGLVGGVTLGAQVGLLGAGAILGAGGSVISVLDGLASIAVPGAFVVRAMVPGGRGGRLLG